jgi:hypothetical protein
MRMLHVAAWQAMKLRRPLPALWCTVPPLMNLPS